MSARISTVSWADPVPVRNASIDLRAHLVDPSAEFGRALRQDDRPGQIVAGRAQEKTESREHPGVRRDQDGRHVEAPAPDRSRAVRRHRRTPAREPAWDRRPVRSTPCESPVPSGRRPPPACRRRRLRVRDPTHFRSSRGLPARQSDRARFPRPAPPSDPRRPATRLASVAVGLAATPSVTGRAGIGAGAVRTHSQSPAGVRPTDASAAGSDGVDGHRRKPAGDAADRALGPDFGPPTFDSAHVGAGPAHVEGNHSRPAVGGSARRRRHHPGRRP